jgi:hypothetical protein
MHHGCIIKVGVDTIFISKNQTNKNIFLLDKIMLVFPYPKRTKTNFASMRLVNVNGQLINAMIRRCGLYRNLQIKMITD